MVNLLKRSLKSLRNTALIGDLSRRRHRFESGWGYHAQTAPFPRLLRLSGQSVASTHVHGKPLKITGFSRSRFEFGLKFLNGFSFRAAFGSLPGVGKGAF